MGNERAKFTHSTKLIFTLILSFGVIVLAGFMYTRFWGTTLQEKIYRVAIDDSWYPLELYDKKQYVTLFSEDLLSQIAENAGASIQYIGTSSGNLLTGLDLGEYDGVLTAFILYGENTDKYLTSKPYYLLGPVLMTATSSHITSLKDLEGKKIGFIRGSNSIASLLKYSYVSIVFYDYNDRFKIQDDIRNNIVDGVFLDMMTAYEFTKSGNQPGEFRIDSIPLGNYGLHLIVANTPQGEKLIDGFNKGLKKMKNSEVYPQLLSKWGLFNPSPKQ